MAGPEAGGGLVGAGTVCRQPESSPRLIQAGVALAGPDVADCRSETITKPGVAVEATCVGVAYSLGADAHAKRWARLVGRWKWSTNPSRSLASGPPKAQFLQRAPRPRPPVTDASARTRFCRCPPPRRTDRHRQLVDLARDTGAAADDYTLPRRRSSPIAQTAARVSPRPRSASASSSAPPFEVTSAPVNSASTRRAFSSEKSERPFGIVSSRRVSLLRWT